MDEALYACRFVQFTAAMLIFGAAAFRVYAFADSDTRTASSILAGFDAWFGHVALAAALVALISAIAPALSGGCDGGFARRRGRFRGSERGAARNPLRSGVALASAARGDPCLGLPRSTAEAAGRPVPLAGIAGKPRLGRTRRHGRWFHQD